MTRSMGTLLDRAGNFLRRMVRKPAWDVKRFVADPRQPQGRRWPFQTLRRTLRCGFLTNRENLRPVETMREYAGSARIPDSTRYDFVGQLAWEAVAALRTQLQAQVRSAWRSKSLAPVGLPCGVAAVENQTRWTGPVAHAHDPAAQVVHPPGRAAYAQVRAVRTVLIAAASKAAMAQVVIRADTNAGGRFPEVLERLETSSGALIEVYSMDAGVCSLAKARRIAAAQTGSIVGLKGNQPELLREAERWRASQRQPELSSPWEKYPGDQIRSHLYRTTEREASLDWSHLTQVWRGEKEMHTGKTGQIERENRYSVTNLHRGRFQAEQILSVVRSHWARENHGHWTVEVIWDEDTKAWCGQGFGIQVLGLLRLMAYHLVSLLRCRYLRTREDAREAKRRWQECCAVVFLLIGGEIGALFPLKPVTPGR